MSQTLRPTNIPGWFEMYRELCPVCGKKGACVIHEKGDRVACIRVTSDRPFSKKSPQSWLHFLKKPQKAVETSNVEQQKGEKKRSPEDLNKVYRTLLNHTILNDYHYQELTSEKRGLTTDQVIVREYRSTSPKPWQVVKAIGETLNMDDFRGVPGFYLHTKQEGQTFWNIAGAKGILIPFRNDHNQVLGFQIRNDQVLNEAVLQRSSKGGHLSAEVKEQPNHVRVWDTKTGEIVLDQQLDMKQMESLVDSNGQHLGFVRLEKGNRYWWLSSANKDGGTSPGNPLPYHVSVPTKTLESWPEGTPIKREAVWLSEGPIKCDIASDFIDRAYSQEEIQEIGDTFIAIPGVQAWRLALPAIKRMEVKRVNLAFDADIRSNIDVQKALIDVAKELKHQGIELHLAQWNEHDGNGIDDLFLNGYKPSMK
ncbi:DUF3854 domain-containing protein, partial [Piscibacillus sp. B03]|uniref:DUF3854 domain-containing protein n=1 Tax=Piscibacillus sp. B03 TaxID=3457430 RepID=UPI003FCD86AA